MGNINNGVLDGVRRIGAKVRDLTIDGQIAGAPLGMRLRGATKLGAPATGTWKAGDTVTDRAGAIWTCIAGGTPGTWAGQAVSFSPLAYGAAGDGTTDDTAALQNCAAAATAVKGVIDLGTRTYKTSSPVNITTGFHMKGAGYQGGTIINSASAIFTIASSVSYVTFEGCNFTSNSGGGHIWDASNGPAMSFWKILGCVMTQNNTGKAIWYQDRGGWIDCLVDQNCNLIAAAGATVSPWTMTNAPGAINSVKFSRSRCLSSGATVPFFNIDPGYSAHTDTVTISTGTPNTVSDTSAVSGDLGFFVYSTAYPGGASAITAVTPGTGYTVGTAATSNFSGSAIVGLKGWGEEIIFDHITWEITTSGAIRMAGAVDVLISNCALWDIPGSRTDTGCGTTSGSPTVTDAAAVSGDVGKAIAGTGIPSGAVITGITAGPGYTISQNATATAGSLTFTVGGPAGNMYSFTKTNTGYPCRNIIVRSGRANANTASAGTGFYDFYADSNSTNILIDSFGSWAIPPVISSPAAQTTIINQTISGAANPQVTSPIFAAAGNTGATTASRYAGATASGAPASGTWTAGDFVIDLSGAIWICTAGGTPGTWTGIVNTSGLASATDPMKIGFNSSYLTTNQGLVSSAFVAANDAAYIRLMAAGYASSNIQLNVANNSGNISVCYYTNSGAGASARPIGGQLATSGAVACPAIGIATVSVGGTVTPALADWVAISCDNTSATFTAGPGGSNAALSNGQTWRQLTAHPLPSTPASLVSDAHAHVLLKGT